MGDDRGAVSIRMPMHPVALELLARTGPLAVSGANRTGTRVPLSAKDAQEQLGYAVSVYLDGGPCVDPSPSTIVDVTGPTPVLLRRGKVSLRQLQEVVPELEEGGRPRQAT
jgi:tRNA A37 threonylcarbamoyladenosine synthetase subunit TsaC/SUA5/YrdC